MHDNIFFMLDNKNNMLDNLFFTLGFVSRLGSGVGRVEK